MNRFFVMVVMMCPLLAFGHEWTPTYPEMRQSFVEGVYTTQMKLFNKRKETRYYEIEVFDLDFNPVKFATNERIVLVDYLKTKRIDIYVPRTNQRLYICSKSKHIGENESKTIISSRVCSKTK